MWILHQIQCRTEMKKKKKKKHGINSSNCKKKFNRYTCTFASENFPQPLKCLVLIIPEQRMSHTYYIHLPGLYLFHQPVTCPLLTASAYEMFLLTTPVCNIFLLTRPDCEISFLQYQPGEVSYSQYQPVRCFVLKIPDHEMIGTHCITHLGDVLFKLHWPRRCLIHVLTTPSCETFHAYYFNQSHVLY